MFQIPSPESFRIPASTSFSSNGYGLTGEFADSYRDTELLVHATGWRPVFAPRVHESGVTR